MSKTSSTENKSITKTIKINDNIFLDVATNMIILVLDRVTLTLTLQEYINFSSSIMGSMSYLQHYVSIKSSISELTKRSPVSSPIQSGSTIF